MARVTYVKKAQPRFEMMPDIDPTTGEQRVVPVMKNGKQKVTKKGKPVTRRLTVRNPDKPKANYKCEKCGVEILVGKPYKWVQPKTSAYGGRKRIRCMDCPSWTRAELSTSVAAPLMQAMDDFDVSGLESKEDINQALTDLGEVAREIAEALNESASNMEDGFGHETEMSGALKERADALESWADDLEQGVDGDDEPAGCHQHEANIVFTGEVPDEPEGEEDEEPEVCNCQDNYDEWIEGLRQEADDKQSESPE